MSRMYMVFGLMGLMALPASFIMGFRYDSAAPANNYLFNTALFAGYMAIHILMLLPGFKKLVYGSPGSAPGERRIFVTVAILAWIALYYFHRPVPGFAFEANFWLQYVGVAGVFLGFLMFFEGVSFGMLSGLLGRPGSEMSHSTDAATPLMTEGSYASVRHPMYRGAVTYAMSSLLVHPHAGQLLFAALFSLGFLLFIPFEERALLKARGEGYRLYMARVRYRVFPGLW